MIKQKQMKAAVVTSFDKPLVIEEVPKPTPGPGEIIVKIETSGVCHTDIHAARGDWPIQPKLSPYSWARRRRYRGRDREGRDRSQRGRSSRYSVARLCVRTL
jgi:hypothetical protein